MGNIISYLRWRGDLVWSEVPFNKVDNLVLSCLSYFDFDGIVPETEENPVSLKHAADRFFSEHKENVPMADLLKVAAASKRFRDVGLWGYQNVIDREQEMTQFAAVHFVLEAGSEYISFRGTDNTTVGWRESFRLGFEIVPAQKRAVQYLDETMHKDGSVCYLVGGHSKGGNLAVYGAMMCSEGTKEQISKIYTNDSPGLCPTLIVEEQYQKIQDKIIKIVPEFSIIGMLFGGNNQVSQANPSVHNNSALIVKSNADGILQHDGLSWQVEGDHFVTTSQLAEKARIYNGIFDRWIESAGFEERKIFVKDFFNALEAGGATTTSELAKRDQGGFEAILFAMVRSEKDSKKVVGKLFHSFFEEIKGIDVPKLFKEKKMIRGIAAFLIGAVFTILPGIALNILGSAFFLWIFIYSLIKIQALVKKKKEWEAEDKIKITFYSIVAVLEMLCILFNNIVVISTNLILAFFFGWRAWTQAKSAVGKKKSGDRWWILPAIESVFAWVLVLVVLGKAGQGMELYILAAGAYLTVGGMYAIGICMLEATKNDN